jgi:hypothetical protein
MPRSGTFLEAAITYYSNLGFDALASMRTTQEELRTGQFEVSKAMSRAASFWLDASEGWWSALLVTAGQPLPTVFLRIGPRDTTATQEANVLVPRDPECAGLLQIGGSGRIDKERLVLTVSAKRDRLGVKLKGLSDDYRPQPGLYQGLVHIGDKALAVVIVEVESDPPTVAESQQRKR